MFVSVQHGGRKIHQINTVCADFQLLLNFKDFLLSGQKRKRASQGGSYDTAEVASLEINGEKEENWFCCPLFLCSTTRLKGFNSETCCRKCTGRSSGSHTSRTARVLRLRWILICWILRDARALKCPSVAGGRRLSKREDVRNGPLTAGGDQASLLQSNEQRRGGRDRPHRTVYSSWDSSRRGNKRAIGIN